MFEAEARERMLAGRRPDPKAKLPQGQAREQAAEAVGVSPRYVQDAKRVAKERQRASRWRWRWWQNYHNREGRCYDF